MKTQLHFKDFWRLYADGEENIYEQTKFWLEFFFEK